MEKGRIYYTRHNGGLTLLKDGKHSVVSNTHPNFGRIIDKLKQREYGAVEQLMSIATMINVHGLSKRLSGRKVFVQKGKVYYTNSHGKQVELHGTLVDRIIQDMGKPSFARYSEALLKFMDNAQKNPLKDIRQELYDWLLSGKTPITYDGCFLAYKNVGHDFMDLHSGKISNAVGAIPRMDPKKVDRDRTNECSVGLHFCSREYLASYTRGDGGHTVIVKVNPKHVFAIPTDYGHQKGRASEYFVVGEYKGSITVDAFKDAFIDEDTKAGAAPEVTFGGWLRPSLENVAKSYGLVLENGKVLIAVVRGRAVPVKTTVKDGPFYDIIGTPVSGYTDFSERSIKTKSVIDALKAAIRKAEKGLTYKAAS